MVIATAVFSIFCQFCSVCGKFSIEVDVTKNGVTSYTRYQFFEMEAIWKLLQIWQGTIQIV